MVVEVSHTGGEWGGDCTVEQAHRQAERDAVDHLQRRLQDAAVRIVSVDSVDVVIAKKAAP